MFVFHKFFSIFLNLFLPFVIVLSFKRIGAYGFFLPPTPLSKSIRLLSKPFVQKISTPDEKQPFPFEKVSPLWVQNSSHYTLLCVPPTMKNGVDGFSVQPIGRPIHSLRLVGQRTNNKGDVISYEEVFYSHVIICHI
jgi:hypothetical protein